MVDPSRFALTPRANIPRAVFLQEHQLKTTLDVDYLVPIYCDEALPGDMYEGSVQLLARLQPLLFPLMDHVTLETFFFSVPMRLLWKNFKKFMGEQASPSDSISYTIPQVVSAANGFPVGSIYDYFELPTVGQIAGGATKSVNSLPLRAYNFIWHEWFRHQDLQDYQWAAGTTDGDGPDNVATFALLKRNKQHDYFTSALPWPLKGGVNVTLPLAGNANVLGIAVDSTPTGATSGPPGNQYKEADATTGADWDAYFAPDVTNATVIRANTARDKPVIYADLSSATGASINALRLAFASQVYLERDARGGTRYAESLVTHWGVHAQDFRLQRPEYIGGGKSAFQTSAIPQTSKSEASNPLGTLAGQSMVSDQHHFRAHVMEHSYIIGLVNVRGQITYQQGLRRMWTRSTRFDFADPAFADLGEQAIRVDEIYAKGNADDDDVWGYQERYAEYRHHPSAVTGLFKGTSASNIDTWHLAEEFGSKPELNDDFIPCNTPMSRALAAGSSANGMQVIMDTAWRVRLTRNLPVYAIPGTLGRF